MRELSPEDLRRMRYDTSMKDWKERMPEIEADVYEKLHEETVKHFSSLKK